MGRPIAWAVGQMWQHYDFTDARYRVKAIEGERAVLEWIPADGSAPIEQQTRESWETDDARWHFLGGPSPAVSTGRPKPARGVGRGE